MSSASTKRISTDSAPADPLDALLGRFDVLVTAIETLAGELKAVAQRLLQEAESKSIQSTVASSVDLLDSSAWVKELEASAAFSAREAERVSLQSENLLEFANSDTRKSFDVSACSSGCYRSQWLPSQYSLEQVLVQALKAKHKFGSASKSAAKGIGIQAGSVLRIRLPPRRGSSLLEVRALFIRRLTRLSESLLVHQFDDERAERLQLRRRRYRLAGTSDFMRLATCLRYCRRPLDLARHWQAC